MEVRHHCSMGLTIAKFDICWTSYRRVDDDIELTVRRLVSLVCTQKKVKPAKLDFNRPNRQTTRGQMSQKDIDAALRRRDAIGDIGSLDWQIADVLWELQKLNLSKQNARDSGNENLLVSVLEEWKASHTRHDQLLQRQQEQQRLQQEQQRLQQEQQRLQQEQHTKAHERGIGFAKEQLEEIDARMAALTSGKKTADPLYALYQKQKELLEGIIKARQQWLTATKSIHQEKFQEQITTLEERLSTLRVGNLGPMESPSSLTEEKVKPWTREVPLCHYDCIRFKATVAAYLRNWREYTENPSAPAWDHLRGQFVAGSEFATHMCALSMKRKTGFPVMKQEASTFSSEEGIWSSSFSGALNDFVQKATNCKYEATHQYPVAYASLPCPCDTLIHARRRSGEVCKAICMDIEWRLDWDKKLLPEALGYARQTLLQPATEDTAPLLTLCALADREKIRFYLFARRCGDDAFREICYTFLSECAWTECNLIVASFLACFDLIVAWADAEIPVEQPRGLVLHPEVAPEHATWLGPRLVLNDANNMIYKVFSISGNCRRANVDYIKIACPDADASLLPNIDNPGYEILVYSKFDGSHTPCNVMQIGDVLMQVHRLHTHADKDGARRPIVHGDVRRANIVFGREVVTAAMAAAAAPRQETARLIDFDFAGVAGVAKYPPMYNIDSSLRREPTAAPEAPLQIAHDIHSLCLLVVDCIAESAHREEVLRLMKHSTLETAANYLYTNGSAMQLREIHIIPVGEVASD